MTWTKRLLTLFFVVLGLYLFGDFRINDVNVRDFLRGQISPQNVKVVKAELSKAWATVYQIMSDGFKNQTVAPESPVQNNPEKDLDQISDIDQLRMKKLLEKHVTEKAPKSKKSGRQANDYLQ